MTCTYIYVYDVITRVLTLVTFAQINVYDVIPCVLTSIWWHLHISTDFHVLKLRTSSHQQINDVSSDNILQCHGCWRHHCTSNHFIDACSSTSHIEWRVDLWFLRHRSLTCSHVSLTPTLWRLIYLILRHLTPHRADAFFIATRIRLLRHTLLMPPSLLSISLTRASLRHISLTPSCWWKHDANVTYTSRLLASGASMTPTFNACVAYWHKHFRKANISSCLLFK